MPKKSPAPATPTVGAVDWPPILKSGPAGVRKWNRLTRAGRREALLKGADLGGADLTGINLAEVEADGASFARCVLAGARLAGASLDGADFTGADLAAADLSGCVCLRASFAGADLRGADLKKSSLQGADLTGADLEGAVLDGGWFDKETRWPAGFAIPPELHWSGRGTDPRFSGKGKKAVAADINGLMTRLIATIDPKRMKRTLDMLKAGRNQIFADVGPAHVRGIVRSQTEEDRYYSCVLTDAGAYVCCTPDLSRCMGLAGEPCKHLLVLLIGLARAGEIDVATVDRWLVAAAGKPHRWNKTTQNHVSDTLLRFKGVQAGEVDWRPTETIPEDFYAM